MHFQFMETKTRVQKLAKTWQILIGGGQKKKKDSSLRMRWFIFFEKSLEFWNPSLVLINLCFPWKHKPYTVVLSGTPTVLLFFKFPKFPPKDLCDFFFILMNTFHLFYVQSCLSSWWAYLPQCGCPTSSYLPSYTWASGFVLSQHFNCLFLPCFYFSAHTLSYLTWMNWTDPHKIKFQIILNGMKPWWAKN